MEVSERTIYRDLFELAPLAYQSMASVEKAGVSNTVLVQGRRT